MKPRISIVIPTHKNIFLREVLISIIHCLGFNSSVEIVVVENPEKTQEIEDLIVSVSNNRKHNILHISSELGANKARNLGIQKSSGEIIALIDDDCIVDRNWLNAILSAHTVYPYVGVIGGSMKLIFKTERPRWIEGFFWSMLAGVDHGDGLIDYSYVRDKYVGMIVSGNLSFKKYIFEQTGGFDETVGYVGKDLLMAHDEIRLIYECSQLGSPKRLYIGNIIVYHQIPAERINIDYFLKRSYGDGYNFVKMICNDKQNDHKLIEDIITEYVLPRWEQCLNVGDLAYLRNTIAHEESMRLYISNTIRCKVQFFQGCYDYLLSNRSNTNLNNKTPLVIEHTNSK